MKNDDNTKSDISPTSMGKQLESKLGGMPPKKDADSIIAANSPSARSAAPGSFRPGGSNAKK